MKTFIIISIIGVSAFSCDAMEKAPNPKSSKKKIPATHAVSTIPSSGSHLPQNLHVNNCTQPENTAPGQEEIFEPRNCAMNLKSKKSPSLLKSLFTKIKRLRSSQSPGHVCLLSSFESANEVKPLITLSPKKYTL